MKMGPMQSLPAADYVAEGRKILSRRPRPAEATIAAAD